MAICLAMLETWREILADSSIRTTMIGAIVLYSLFYPAAYIHQVAGQLPVVVVDLDDSHMSRELLREASSVREIELVAKVNSLDEARAWIEAGNAEGILMIDTQLQRDILRGDPGRVLLFGNGAYLGRANTVLQGMGAAISGFAVKNRDVQASFKGGSAPGQVQVVQRPLYNTYEGYGSAIVPGVAQLIIHQTLLMGIGLLLGTRREQQGKALRMNAQSLTGCAAALWLLGWINLLYYAGLVFWAQDYPAGANLSAVLLTGGLFVAVLVALGLFIGSLFRCREQALQLLLITALPMFFLSGLSWPKESLPQLLQWLSFLLPTTPAINGLIKVNQMGASLYEVRTELLNLGLLLLLYGGLAMWRLLERTPAHLMSVNKF
ncbi:ABC transporter permease [Pseudomonas tolaasii]|uniref:ABC transporter permease n=1 Tax=Pseudomonas tolaasii TaxID=29442 RepID=UPI0018E1A8B3|nr:ABC transporter permease [Pseudomonas tolaasii]